MIDPPSRQTPANDLPRLQRQAATAGCYVVAEMRALTPTAARLRVTFAEAESYIRETIRCLHLRDFVERVLMRNRWFDVYGCYRDKLGWYVKIGEDDDGLIVVSHHEPELLPLTTVAGAEIYATMLETGS
jgi:hypothetical protein